MKRIKLLIVPILGLLILSFTIKSSLDTKTVKYLEKHSHWRQVNDKLFMFSTETTNLQYREFLNSLKQTGKLDEYNKYQVDTTGWLRDMTWGKPLAENYHNHSAYNDYPVVNVSHEAAQAYCKWLTHTLNTQPGFKHFFKKVECRLPDRNEWLAAAKGGNETNMYPWGGPFVRNSKGQILANFKYMPQAALKQEDSATFSKQPVKITTADNSFMITTPGISYWPNGYDLYNMAGNVAEMLNEPGTTIGGSWRNTAYYMRLDVNADPYKGWEKPNPCIGFRVVMEVVEE